MPINSSVGVVKGISKGKVVGVGSTGVVGVGVTNGFGRFGASLAVLEHFKNNLILFGGVLYSVEQSPF